MREIDHRREAMKNGEFLREWGMALRWERRQRVQTLRRVGEVIGSLADYANSLIRSGMPREQAHIHAMAHYAAAKRILREHAGPQGEGCADNLASNLLLHRSVAYRR